jgi:hypothetical protein
VPETLDMSTVIQQDSKVIGESMHRRGTALNGNNPNFSKYFLKNSVFPKDSLNCY